MSLPHSLRTSITPPELELISSQQLIDIIPLISMERTAFISVRASPVIFTPSPADHFEHLVNPSVVGRVWTSQTAKSVQDWLTVEFLQERVNRETTGKDFSDLPFRFAELSKVLLDVASDDLQNPDKLRFLLKDLREARQAKSREGLRKLDHSELTLSNLCSMEINEIRPFFVRAMGVLTQLARQPAEPGEPHY